MNIRFGTEQDLPRLLEFGEAIHAELDYSRWAPWRPHDWKQWFLACTRELNLVCIVAEVDGTVVAQLTGTLCALYWCPSLVYGQETFLWVEPEYRQRGIASHLFAWFEAWAQSMGAEFVTAAVPKSGAGMQALLVSRKYDEVENWFMKKVS